MIAAALMLAQAASLSPPADWAGLPTLPLRQRADQPDLVSDYVRAESRAGRCSLAEEETALDLAVFVAASGQIRRIVPRAIGCPTVEQYAAGIVLRFARGNIVAPITDGWFRASVALKRP